MRHYTTDRDRVRESLEDGPQTLDDLRRNLKIASPGSRISELIQQDVPVRKRFIPHLREDGHKVFIKEYWIDPVEDDDE